MFNEPFCTRSFAATSTNRVARPDLERDRLAHQRLHEDLHAARPDAQRLLLIVLDLLRLDGLDRLAGFHLRCKFDQVFGAACRRNLGCLDAMVPFLRQRGTAATSAEPISFYALGGLARRARRMERAFGCTKEAH